MRGYHYATPALPLLIAYDGGLTPRRASNYTPLTELVNRNPNFLSDKQKAGTRSPRRLLLV